MLPLHVDMSTNKPRATNKQTTWELISSHMGPPWEQQPNTL
jgi:hypothetical protein